MTGYDLIRTHLCTSTQDQELYVCMYIHDRTSPSQECRLCELMRAILTDRRLWGPCEDGQVAPRRSVRNPIPAKVAENDTGQLDRNRPRLNFWIEGLKKGMNE